MKLGSASLPILFFFFCIVFALLTYKCWNQFVVTTKILLVFWWGCIKSIYQFGEKRCLLCYLNFPIHEHKISFHLLRFSLIFFISILLFYLLGTIVNGILKFNFLIFLCWHIENQLTLKKKKSTLYPATMLYSHSHSGVFLLATHFVDNFLGYLHRKSCYLWVKSVLLLPLNFVYLYFSLPCLIELARTYSTMLNGNGERGYPCLIPDLMWKVLVSLHKIWY